MRSWGSDRDEGCAAARSKFNEGAPTAPFGAHQGTAMGAPTLMHVIRTIDGSMSRAFRMETLHPIKHTHLYNLVTPHFSRCNRRPTEIGDVLSHRGTAFHRLASEAPADMSTRIRMGTGTASMINRNKKPRRILPVTSAITPTMKGPMNEADLSVSAKREKKDDSWPLSVSTVPYA